MPINAKTYIMLYSFKVPCLIRLSPKKMIDIITFEQIREKILNRGFEWFNDTLRGY